MWKSVPQYLNVKVTVFWNMTPYILAIYYRRFRRAAAYFAISSVHLPLLPELPILCSWSSIVEWPTIAPWPHIFVVNRRTKWALIRNNVQQHDLSAINKTDFNLTTDLWDGKVFLDEPEWDFDSLVKSQSLQGLQPWHSQRLCYEFTQVLPLAGDHPRQSAPYKDTVWEPQPAHATVSSCKSFL